MTVEKILMEWIYYICGVVGFIITGLLIWITEYYTGTNYRPVKTVAQSSTTGHGTNVIQGLAISMEATAVPALIIVAGILYTNDTCRFIWYSYSSNSNVST